MSEMKIRKAKLKDCDKVHELCKTKELINPNGKPPKKWWIESFVKENQIFFVAEEKNKIAGFIIGERTTGNVALLQILFVRKNFRRMGI